MGRTIGPGDRAKNTQRKLKAKGRAGETVAKTRMDVLFRLLGSFSERRWRRDALPPRSLFYRCLPGNSGGETVSFREMDAFQPAKLRDLLVFSRLRARGILRVFASWEKSAKKTKATTGTFGFPLGFAATCRLAGLRRTMDRFIGRLLCLLTSSIDFYCSEVASPGG